MLWWVASLIHAEYLTNMYGNEFYQTVNKECGIENGGYYKVLDYKHLKYVLFLRVQKLTLIM